MEKYPKQGSKGSQLDEILDSIPADAATYRPSKLKPDSSHSARNFASALSILAIAVSLASVYIAELNQKKLAEAAGRIDAMAALIESYKGHLKKYEAAMMEEKALQDEERKKRDYLVRQIIQSVSQQQVKMKISPTLDEVIQASIVERELQKLQGAASAVSATKALPAPGELPAAEESKKQPDSGSDNKKTAAAKPAQTQKETGSKVKSIRDAIKKLNKDAR